MSSNSIGGFFVDLGLRTDKDSFDKGFKAVDQMTNSINRLVGTIRNAAPVIMAGLAGSFETAELKTAKAIGVSTRALDTWKTAASMAGTNANGLTQSMANLEQKMQGLKLGQIDQGLAQNLGFLGINYNDFADMDATERLSTVMKTAAAMEDQGKAALLVGNILGESGKDYYYYLQLSGKTLEGQLAIGKSLVFTSEKSKKDAMEFNSELQGVVSAGKSMSMLFGSEVGKQLTPIVRGVREWIGANNGLIQQGIVGFVDDVGTVFNKVVGTVVKVAPIVKDMIDGFGGLDQVIIKIGIGIAALQVGKLATNLMSIFSSVSMVKLALMGLGTGALVGGFFELLKDPKTMKSVSDSLDKIKSALAKIFGLNGDAKIGDAVKKLGDALSAFGKLSLDTAMKLLADLANVFENLWNGKWDDLGKNMKQFFTDLGEGLKGLNNFVNGDKTGEQIISQGGFGGAWGKTTAIISGDPKLAEAAWVTQQIQSMLGADYQRVFGVLSAITPWSSDRLTMNDLSPDTLKAVQEYKAKGGNLSAFDRYIKVNDGIISPSGTVTQVAPNDWVFAAKDLGKLASAFIPQAYSSNSSSSYIINQTFNVSGSHDIPSTIKQQAYAGTQAALLQNVNNSATRLQLMSNTY